MIELDHITARAAPIAIGPLSLRFRAGITALIGTKKDGVSLLLDVIAGRVRTSSGRARVLDGFAGDADVRRAVGYVPLDAVLPDSLRVREAVELSTLLRGDTGNGTADAIARLDEVGMAHLSERYPRVLDRGHVRAGVLAEAISSRTVRVLLIEEPFVAMDPRAATIMARRLRTRASEGACVVIATASLRDAHDLADTHHVIDHGLVADRNAVGRAELHVTASDLRALAAALSSEQDVAEIAVDDHRIVVRGPSLALLGRAVSRAVLASGAVLESMRPASLKVGREPRTSEAP